MKKVLAIDTSTSRTEIAFLIDGEVQWLEYEDGATTHGDVLAKFGAKAAKEKIDQVIVGMGPGPYTGLRTGIVFAKSFAFARNIPIKGVCSLDAIGHCIDLPEFIVATDARRKELYWAKYSHGKRVSDLMVTSPNELPDLPKFGEGAVKYGIASNPMNQFPTLVNFPDLEEVNEVIYLRHPDAVATVDRK